MRERLSHVAAVRGRLSHVAAVRERLSHVADVRERLAYVAYTAGWVVVRRLPERAAYALFTAVADLAWRRRGARVRQLERNLRRVVGAQATDAELRALARAAMRAYLRYWCDVFRLPDWGLERTVSSVRTLDEHRLRDPIAAGRGVVAALPHMGNWDHAGAWVARSCDRVTTVAERVRPERLFERFVAFRAALGLEILPLTGGPEPVSDVLLRRVQEGAVVALLADRDLRRSGVEVRFFGEQATFPPGPALLAARTGAALLPVTLHTDDGELVVTFHPEVPDPGGASLTRRVTTMTQQVAAAFERGIREHPQDWHMLQPLWAADVGLEHGRAGVAPVTERVARWARRGLRRPPPWMARKRPGSRP